MKDLSAAIAAAREALHEHDAYGMPIDAGTIRDLLVALDAAQGEAVLGSVQSGSVTIPFWVIDYAQKIELFMKVNGVDAWALGGIQSRDLPPLQAPPAQPLVERYGDGVLVHWPEGVEQYVQVGDCVTGYLARPTQPVAVPAGYVPVSALIEAREQVESWGAYAAPYFTGKWDLAGTLAKMDAQIAAARRGFERGLAARKPDRIWQDRNGALRTSPADCQSFGADGWPIAVYYGSQRFPISQHPLTDEETSHD